MKLPEVNLNIQVTEVVAKPRMLKCTWTMSAAMDLTYGMGIYDAWIEKVSKPGYTFTEKDISMLEGLGYPGITVEELQGSTVPPEITEDRISTEEDSQTWQDIVWIIMIGAICVHDHFNGLMN